MTRIGHDPDAFYRDHIGAVQRFVARRIGDPHLAADLTADVFLAAIEGAHTDASDRDPVIAWLYGMSRMADSTPRRDGSSSPTEVA